MKIIKKLVKFIKKNVGIKKLVKFIKKNVGLKEIAFAIFMIYLFQKKSQENSQENLTAYMRRAIERAQEQAQEQAQAQMMGTNSSGGNVTSQGADDLLHSEIFSRLNINGLVGHYTGDSFEGTTWKDISGNGNDANNNKGSVTTGDWNGKKTVKGGIDTGILFPNAILPNNYSLFYLSRYTGSNKGRIIQGNTGNWLSGHHGDKSGVAYHEGWVTDSKQNHHGSNWVLGTDQNRLYRSNGVERGKAGGGTTTRLAVNISGWAFTINELDEASDWEIAEILVYNRHLNIDEIKNVEGYLAHKYMILSDIDQLVATYPIVSDILAGIEQAAAEQAAAEQATEEQAAAEQAAEEQARLDEEAAEEQARLDEEAAEEQARLDEEAAIEQARLDEEAKAKSDAAWEAAWEKKVEEKAAEKSAAQSTAQPAAKSTAQPAQNSSSKAPIYIGIFLVVVVVGVIVIKKRRSMPGLPGPMPGLKKN